jgi:hypothetical protein
MPATAGATPTFTTPPPGIQSSPPSAGLPPAIDGTIGDREYPSTRQYENYQLFWRTEGTNIFIGIRARTTGWVAIGFGNGMNNSDLILCAVLDGRPMVTDQFGQGLSHREDTALGGTNDIAAFTGVEKDGFTSFEFRRALNTGDKYDGVLTKGTNPISWSYGTADDMSSKHTARGRGEITIE